MSESHSEPAEIGTVVASRDVAVDPRTGEPRRPWLVVVASVLLHAGVVLAVAGLLWTFWWSIDHFTEAAWLHRVTPTEPGDLLRVGMVTAEFAIVLAIGAAAGITGYHAWWGRRWSRWAGLLATGLSCTAIVINPVAAWSIAPIAVGSLLLWLPPAASFFGRWHLRRHPEPVPPSIVDDVYYGPLERYR